MIALVISAVVLTGLVLLARLEGTLPVEEEPPGNQGRRAGANAGRTDVQLEVIRFTVVLAAATAGAALAAGVLALSGSRLLLVPTALITLLVMATVLCSLELSDARRARMHGERARGTRLRFLGPLGTLIRAVSRLGARLVSLGERKGAERHDVDVSEQFSRVVSSETDMSKDEEKLLRGAISLPRTSVHDVMVPRVEIVGVEFDTPWSEVLDRIRSSEHSRLPVFRGSLDDIVGILVAKDVLPYALAEKAPPDGWQSLTRPAAFVPSTKGIDDQLRDFRQSRTHMAIVVDEYGGTAGLLTIEDVLEEVVGEIRDEHDVEEAAIRSEDNQRFWVHGRVPLDELEAVLGEECPSRLATTTGGLVFERLGRVPRVGEELVWGNYRVVVDRMKRHTVDRVYFERLGGDGGERR